MKNDFPTQEMGPCEEHVNAPLALVEVCALRQIWTRPIHENKDSDSSNLETFWWKHCKDCTKWTLEVMKDSFLTNGTNIEIFLMSLFDDHLFQVPSIHIFSNLLSKATRSWSEFQHALAERQGTSWAGLPVCHRVRKHEITFYTWGNLKFSLQLTCMFLDTHKDGQNTETWRFGFKPGTNSLSGDSTNCYPRCHGFNLVKAAHFSPGRRIEQIYMMILWSENVTPTPTPIEKCNASWFLLNWEKRIWGVSGILRRWFSIQHLLPVCHKKLQFQ